MIFQYNIFPSSKDKTDDNSEDQAMNATNPITNPNIDSGAQNISEQS